MRIPRARRALLPLVLTLSVMSVPLAAGTASPARAAEGTPDYSALPDPTARGGYTPTTIQEAKLGLVDLQEPNSSGAAPGTGLAQSAEQLEVRGALYYPADRAEPSPVLILVHGNHGSCDAGQDAANASCAAFKRNEAGYAYLGENLATWGYTTFSVSQDQLMMRQDNSKGKGMHQRRLLIAAALDALSKANAEGLTNDAHTTIGDTLEGKLDMTRIGLMGHSRGGDAVTSFIDYNRTRTDGPRYPLRGVISLAPVDYERKAPYGMPYMSILPFCDGDVSNLQGARFYERSQYVNPGDPFPRIQSSQLGAIHNWYNTVWYADGGADGQNNNDAACGNSSPFTTTNVHPHNLRLSGAANPQAIVPRPGTTNGSHDTAKADNYVIDHDDTFNPLVNTKISGDPARMGDQEKIGLATMAAFFRRYVGGEGAFEPYMTGELSATASHRQIPASACPTSESGTRIDCAEYVSTSYFAAPDERVDIIRPEVTNPLGQNALGAPLTGTGFAEYDWCNPEPDDFAPAQLGKTTQPTGAKACPLPAKAALGGQNGTRENAPVNHSYGRQLALAWEADEKARLTAVIPAADADVSGLKALAMGADVNFFDLRNPGADNRGDNTKVGAEWPNELPTSYDPTSTSQDFIIAMTDRQGNEGTVHAGDEKWGNALHMSTGTNTPNTHIVLDQIRVPLTEFADQGVDLTQVAEVELRFGEAGTPSSGSIQLADVRFQEKDGAPQVLSDGADKADGAGHGAPGSGPDPATYLEAYDVSKGNLALIDTVGQRGATTVWTVDDDKAQCPDAQFSSIQKAVDFAAPWDTIVVCEGVYEESSTPFAHASNPVALEATNGLTITKPLKIKGAGADKVTIRPKPSVDDLAGLVPYLRDGGGNVITVSRQSLGSTDTNEMFVDISGVTVTSGNTWAEAGIAFFGAAGRVNDSVVGPLRTATSAGELAEHPHGYGIVKTSLILGAGKGTVENEVTVTDSVVTGYQSGGILFDGGRGKDGAADNAVRTGTRQHGYVVRTVVKGRKSSVFPQTGVEFANGVDGLVKDSRITTNWFAPDPARSAGLLLSDAGVEGGQLTASGNAITGNGLAVANVVADGSSVRADAPFTISGSYLGTAAPATSGVGDPATGVEAVTGSGSVVVSQRATSVPAGVPSAVGAIVDDAPEGRVVEPTGATELTVGQPVTPVVRASDDLAVAAVTLLADDVEVATSQHAPYTFAFTPTGEMAGEDVTFKARITDAAGNVTTTDAVTAPVVAAPPGTLVPATPTITGTARVGVKLTAVAGTWGPEPVTLAYQWLRAGAPIAGATKATYTAVAADRGRRLSVAVTGTKDGFTTLTVPSAPTASVAAGILTTAVPRITGTARVGRTLQVTVGTWGPAPVTKRIQWLRNGKVIRGATRAGYRLVRADRGKRITVRVTGSKAGYTTVARTSAAKVVR